MQNSGGERHGCVVQWGVVDCVVQATVCICIQNSRALLFSSIEAGRFGRLRSSCQILAPRFPPTIIFLHASLVDILRDIFWNDCQFPAVPRTLQAIATVEKL